MNEQISTPSLELGAGSFVHDLTAFLIKRDPMKTSTAINQISYIEKLATLTLQYLELSLPLPAALRAAEADL